MFDVFLIGLFANFNSLIICLNNLFNILKLHISLLFSIEILLFFRFDLLPKLANIYIIQLELSNSMILIF